MAIRQAATSMTKNQVAFSFSFESPDNVFDAMNQVSKPDTLILRSSTNLKIIRKLGKPGAPIRNLLNDNCYFRTIRQMPDFVGNR